MSKGNITVENLSKCYRLQHKSREQYTALRDVLADKVRGLFRSGGVAAATTTEEFWALKDVSFEVKQGEVLAIIGRNGAGKSTLLKLLSRITEPSSGRIRITGRVASLLEVGTGFHPELTGRENIFLNGAILGMTRAEIRAKFDEIVAFAEVEKFLDTPVKRYSSGMYVRLAFAVAAHLEPEILVVDEVLAVGDAAFQKKCIGRMNKISHEQGRTVLFVSHNMSAVRSLCNRAVMLDQGRLVRDADVESVLSTYAALSKSNLRPEACKTYGSTVKLNSVELVDDDGNQIDRATLDQKVGFQVNFEVLSDTHNPDIWISLYTNDGALAFSSCMDRSKSDYRKARKRLVCWVQPNLLNSNSYTVRVVCMDSEKHMTFFDIPEAIAFEAQEDSNQRSTAYRGPWLGCVRPTLEWEYLKA